MGLRVCIIMAMNDSAMYTALYSVSVTAVSAPLRTHLKCTEVLISPEPDQEGNKQMFLSEWREFPSAPCLAGTKKDPMTARVSMLLKSRTSLTCFRTCFFPGRAKELSAPQ